MQFNSWQFMLFFPVVTALYFVIPAKLRAPWLLIASYYFYMSWNPVYALLIGFSTLVTYLCGRLLARTGENRKQKKIILAAGLTVNLLILAVFKYGNFALTSVQSLFNLLHISVRTGKLDLLLPVGISFYTFQALGYVIDVYRGDVKAEKSLLRYALFVSFFPQLVAGPIERSGRLLGQLDHLEEKKLWNFERVSSGAVLMVWGLFLKMVIADRAAVLVDTVFDNYRMYGSTELILAAVCFAVQIYCDFSSYSTIAIGAARILDVDLMENFNTPYFAVSVRDFWSRWHISLSTWFRDYLYIPLGGNRKGRARQYLNLMIVFLVSGLWHGAGWNFVAWGGIHGLCQIFEHAVKPAAGRLVKALHVKTEVFSWKLLNILKTFVITDFAWIFFRSDTLTDALRYVQRIITNPTPWLWLNGGIYELGLDRTEFHVLELAVLALLLVDLIRSRFKQTLDGFLAGQNLWFKWTVLILLIWALFIFGEYGPAFDAQQFIYFQF